MEAAKIRTVARLEEVGASTDDLDRAMERALALGDRLLGLATEMGPEISRVLREGRSVLLEGPRGPHWTWITARTPS